MEINKWTKNNFSLKKPANWNCPNYDIGILTIDRKLFYFECI